MTIGLHARPTRRRALPNLYKLLMMELPRMLSIVLSQWKASLSNYKCMGTSVAPTFISRETI